MSRLETSRIALDLIKSFEGFRAKAAQLKNGGYTIGYGHVATAREGMQITREQAEELLKWDVKPIEYAIRQMCFAPISQQQFDALVSFVFNIGIDNFKDSDVLKHINQGEPIAAAIAMNAWRRANLNGKIIIVDALVRRRAHEMALFLETIGPRPAATSSVISPKLDYSAALLAPDVDKIREISPIKNSAEFEIIDKIVPQEPISNEEIKAEETATEPFPENELPSPSNVANQEEILEIAPANDLKPQRPKPLDALKSKGIEFQTANSNEPDFSVFFIWLVFVLGIIALVYGVFHLKTNGVFDDGIRATKIYSKDLGNWLLALSGLLSTIVGAYALLSENKTNRVTGS